MPTSKEYASSKRFGARYGRRLKHRFALIENLHRRRHKCPYCTNDKVKRISVGIWECRKCGAKFASKAYTVAKKKTAKELAAEIAVKVTEEANEEEKAEVSEGLNV